MVWKLELGFENVFIIKSKENIKTRNNIIVFDEIVIKYNFKYLLYILTVLAKVLTLLKTFLFVKKILYSIWRILSRFED
jgi:hypothetical protein